jgi:hypothetical protein
MASDGFSLGGEAMSACQRRDANQEPLPASRRHRQAVEAPIHSEVEFIFSARLRFSVAERPGELRKSTKRPQKERE